LEVHNIALGAGTASKLSASALVDKMWANSPLFWWIKWKVGRLEMDDTWMVRIVAMRSRMNINLILTYPTASRWLLSIMYPLFTLIRQPHTFKVYYSLIYFYIPEKWIHTHILLWSVVAI
jgi:hypothetical protein